LYLSLFDACSMDQTAVVYGCACAVYIVISCCL